MKKVIVVSVLSLALVFLGGGAAGIGVATDNNTQTLRGPPGEQGPEGPAGPVGPAGPAGPRGAPGINAAQTLTYEGVWEPGVTYAPGAVVSDGNLLYVATAKNTDSQPPSSAWSALPLGAQGEKGEQGEQGPAGKDGATGPEGPAGEQGIQGEQGPPGEQGPVGERGPQGEQGAQGPVGATGDTGARGPEGAQGPAGPEGPIGPAGPTGPEGPQGPQGLPGMTCPKGFSPDTLVLNAPRGQVTLYVCLLDNPG